MIYMETDGGQKVLVLEPANLRHLREGGVVASPNGAIAVMFSPDTTWLGEAIKQSSAVNELTPEKLSSLHKKSMQMQPVIERPDHPLRHIIQDGKATPEEG